jgi:hypothetical protein
MHVARTPRIAWQKSLRDAPPSPATPRIAPQSSPKVNRLRMTII